MARNNLYNSQQDRTIPPESYNNEESIIEGKTIPEDADPRRQAETQPDYDSFGTRTVTERREGGTPRFMGSRAYEPTVIDDEVEPPRPSRSKKSRTRRVVGWLVGIEGACRGIDFRLHEGKNYIGRDARCEVNIEDKKVSAGSVAQVVFDPRSKRFFSSDCDGTATICYQNGEPLLGRSQLKLYDRIELGDTTLLFVPLCGEKFTWEEEDKDSEKKEEDDVLGVTRPMR